MKSIFEKLREIYKRELFQPTLLGILINPFYIIRRGLLSGVKRNAHHLKGVMLDFGCGNKPYRNLISVEKYIGLDIEKSGHDHANEDIDVYYDGHKVPFDDGHFDSILCSEVLEHVLNTDEVLSEISRVTKRGGTILVTVPFVWDLHEEPYDFIRYTTYGITGLLEKHGFEVVLLERSTTYIETLTQMTIAYIFKCIFPENKYVRTLLTIIFIFPITVLGLAFSRILPRNKNFYSNNIVVAKKIENLRTSEVSNYSIFHK